MEATIEPGLTIYTAGNDELLEANHTRYVVFQAGELSRGREITQELHARIPRGMSTRFTSSYILWQLIVEQGRN